MAEWWREFYPKLYALLGELVTSPEITRAEVAWVMRTADLEAGHRLVDVGCGPGRHAVALAEAGIEVLGLDVSEPLINNSRARARAAGVDSARFEVIDMRRLAEWPDWPQEPLDAAILMDSVSGVFDADQTEQILRAVGARLRPGGTLLLSQVEPDWCRQQDQGWMLRAADGQLLHRRIRFDEPTQTLIDEVSIADHAGQPPEPIPAQRLRLYEHDDLRALLTRAGFSDVVIQVGVRDARQRLLATSETYAAGTWG